MSSRRPRRRGAYASATELSRVIPSLASAAFQLFFGWLLRPDVRVDCRTDTVVAHVIEGFSRQLTVCQDSAVRHTCVCAPCPAASPGACPVSEAAAPCPSCWGPSFYWLIFVLGVLVGFSGFATVGVLYRVVSRRALPPSDSSSVGRRVSGIGRPARLAVTDGA